MGYVSRILLYVSCKLFVKFELVANREQVQSSLKTPLANAVYGKNDYVFYFAEHPACDEILGFVIP